MTSKSENVWRTNRALIRESQIVCERLAKVNEDCQQLIEASRAILEDQAKARAWKPLLPPEIRILESGEDPSAVDRITHSTLPVV